MNNREIPRTTMTEPRMIRVVAGSCRKNIPATAEKKGVVDESGTARDS